MRGGEIVPKARIVLFVVILISGISLTAGCLGNSSDDRTVMIVTILPQEEIVSAIGGDYVRVTVMVPPGASPHSFEPTPSQLEAVANAAVYFAVGSGVEFELLHLGSLMEQNTHMTVVNCSEGIDLKTWDEHLGGTEEEGIYDPHIWLSPPNMMIMAQNVCDAMVNMDPVNKDYYEHNLRQYLESMSQLDDELRNKLSDFSGRSFLTYHPSWGYFCDAYNLTQIPIEKAGQKPGPAGIAAIIDQARSEGIKVIAVAPQFDESSAEVIAEAIDGKVVFADPLPLDYADAMIGLADDLVEGFIS